MFPIEKLQEPGLEGDFQIAVCENLMRPLLAAQVKFDLERQRDNLQRQAAALEGKLQIAAGRCEEAEGQCQALRQQLALENQRAAELETLLGRLRASQFQVTF